jgi:hypothetical protein
MVLHKKDYGQGEPVLVLMGGPGFSGEERFKKLLERVKYEWEHFEE